MADEERLEIGVEYRGSAAFDQFARDMSVLPEEFSEVVGAIGAAAGQQQGVVQRYGMAIARAYKAGVALELAAAQGQIAQAMQGLDIGQLAGRSATAAGANAREAQVIVDAVNKVQRDVEAGTRQLLSQSDMSSVVREIGQIETAANRATTALERQAAAQRTAAQQPTTLQKDIEAVRTAPVSAQTREELAQAVATTAQARQDARATAMQQVSSPARTRAMEGLVTLGPGVTNTDIAAATGVSRQTVGEVRREYAEQIAAVHGATEAHRQAQQVLADYIRSVRGLGPALPGQGRNVFDTRTNPYIEDQFSPQGSLYVRNRDAYERLWRELPITAAEADRGYIQQNIDDVRAMPQTRDEIERMWRSFGLGGGEVDRRYIEQNIADVRAMPLSRDEYSRLWQSFDTSDADNRAADFEEFQRRSSLRQRELEQADLAAARNFGVGAADLGVSTARQAEEERARRDREFREYQRESSIRQSLYEREDTRSAAEFGVGLADRPEAMRRAAELAEREAEFERYRQASNARVGRLESADLEAGRTRGVSSAEAVRQDEERALRLAQMRQRIEENIAQTRAASGTGASISGTARPLLQGTPLGAPGSQQLSRQEYVEAFGGGIQRPSFRQGFMAGFSGPDNRDTAEMIGQTARISLFYGVAFRMLGLLQQGLETAVRETVAYEEALTALNVVTGRTRAENDRFAQTLGDIAVAAGFTPSQGVELGSRALGLYGVASADQATQERTVEISAEVASRMARVSGGDPIATQTQLAGALRSLGWGIDRLPELEDTVSFISRQTGQAPTELLGALANVATLGSQSGFSPQEIAALLAQVGTTTGQNPEGTAGQFRQLLSQNAALLVPRAEQIVGQDLEANTLQELFSEVSQLNLSADQLNRFSSLFGKGGSQQVALILTQQYGEVQRLSGGAANAQGFGEEAFNEVMGSFGNKVRELGAVFADFGVTLIETGILDWLGALVIATTGLLEAGTAILDAFNQLPRPMRAVALALAEIYAASLLMARMNVGGTLGAVARNVAGRTAFGRRQIATAAEEFGDPTPGRGTPAWLQRGGPIFLDADQRANAGRAGRFTGLTSAGMAGAAAAGVGLVGAGIATAVNIDNDAQQRVVEARAALASAESLQELRDAAAMASESLQELRSGGLAELTPGDVGGLLPAIFTDLLTGGEQAELARSEAEATRRADALEKAQQAAVERDPANVFTDFSAEGIETGLAGLADQGYTAAERLQMLNRAMFDFTSRAGTMENAVAVIDRAEFGTVGAKVGQAGVDAVNRARGMFEVSRDAAVLSNGTLVDQGLPRIFDPIIDRLPWSTASEANGRLERFDFSVDDETALREALSTATQDVLADTVSGNGILDRAGQEGVVAKAQQALRAELGEDRWADLVADGQEQLFTAAMDSAVRGILAGFGGELTEENLGAYIQAAPALAEARATDVQRSTGSQIAANQTRLQELRDAASLIRAQGRTQGGLSEEDQRWLNQLDIEIRIAERAVIQDRIASIEAISRLQQAQLGGDDVMGRLAVQRQALQQTRQADRPRTVNVPLLGSVILPTAEWMQRQMEYQAQAAQIAQQEQQEQVAIAQNRARANVNPGDAIGQAAAGITGARAALTLLTEGSSQWWAAQGQLTSAMYQHSQAQVQAANANRLAGVDPRNELGRIQVQITNARAEMALLPRNQRGALQDQINQLNQQYAEAVVNQTNAMASANIAGNSSALVQGRVAIENAQRTLGTQLGGTSGYYSALSALREAQSQLAQAERDQADRVRRLGSDLTDPVEQARLDVQRAREQLAANQASGQGPDIIAQSQLDVRSAENAAEQAAFSQRISDLQTAEDLGRISHSAYMSYLQSEHDRLTAISDRTRQQQDQLDQVDKLMKSAAEEMQGQFNIGDIDLPSVYEVRRAMQSGAPASVADYSNSNNVVNVNGADFGQVVEWLTSYLGAGAQVVTAATPRRI